MFMLKLIECHDEGAPRFDIYICEIELNVKKFVSRDGSL